MDSVTSGREARSNGGTQGDADGGGGGEMQKQMYLRFAAMIATSTMVMFFLMYTSVWSVDHARWSEERFYMAFVMAGAMVVIMLGFMWGTMYKNTKWNIGILLAGLAVLSGALWLSRSQHFVDDRAYMQGMIPHHSIAILTSERADIDDVRVRALANDINRAQRIEIKEMDWLIDDIEEHGPALTEEEAAQRPVPSFEAEGWREGVDN